MTLALLDNQALAQLELSAYIQQQSAPEYEIDSVTDEFGTLYRVWGGEKGINLLGTFYQNRDAVSWISQPCHSVSILRWKTSEQAVAAILSA